jgi:hypothetical protein
VRLSSAVLIDLTITVVIRLITDLSLIQVLIDQTITVIVDLITALSGWLWSVTLRPPSLNTVSDP